MSCHDGEAGAPRGAQPGGVQPELEAVAPVIVVHQATRAPIPLFTLLSWSIARYERGKVVLPYTPRNHLSERGAPDLLQVEEVER
eukprot:CAMPEP_0206376268 /NCGR_PEP_ID=MMETSP0294-20121207/9378_1 /ASSEMBLY_ACC=CAM_ASM_000327 /TAXON_ID=39354 /ORGANISM="Heterosigma akashiwo, Strain CCMP2393" /LENGTH=84 /DNA_ID=CAMNT_0053824355 /DNA_START=617 /DNA_END=867 /DNA_ORIENTATION=+